MSEYDKLKVPDLKKLLGERSLPVSGNKAELIARLVENDRGSAADKLDKSAGTGGVAEDEIDWDEDDTKNAQASAARSSTANVASTNATAGTGAAKTPVAVPNQKVDIDAAKTTDLSVKEPAVTSAGGDDAAAVGAEGKATDAEPPTTASTQNFSAGIEDTDAAREAEKRAARAKRFGITEPKGADKEGLDNDEQEAKKRDERAKKFGTASTADDAAQDITKSLDSALPERRAKRPRDKDGEGRSGDANGRNAKRQTPDRRAGAGAASQGKERRGGGQVAEGVKKAIRKILDDPIEKAKAEARAAKFATSK